MDCAVCRCWLHVIQWGVTYLQIIPRRGKLVNLEFTSCTGNTRPASGRGGAPAASNRKIVQDAGAVRPSEPDCVESGVVDDERARYGTILSIVEDEPAMEEYSIDNLKLGERIRDRRQELSLSLRDLAELTDLSATFLSALERGLANPTLASVRRLANALKVPLHRLLADSSDNSLVVLKDRRRSMLFPDSNVKYEILTPQLTRKMVLFQVDLPPEAGNIIQQPLAEPTEECIVVLAGKLEIQLAGQVYELKAGDSIYFENRYMDSIRAVGECPAEYISAVARPG
jgi:transcriptional regulator with XRE-family HTH domain